MLTRRTVRVVSEQRTYKGDKSRMSAYGEMALASVAKCSTRTVRRAIESGDLEMNSMESALIWIGNRRKKIKAANSAADRQ